MEHFQENHYRDEQGRFIVPLPIKPQTSPLGESRSSAFRRFQSLECALRRRMNLVNLIVHCRNLLWCTLSQCPLRNQTNLIETYYLLLQIHVVKKEISSINIISMSGASLNDQLLVGPTVQGRIQGGARAGGAVAPHFHEERQRMTNESTAKMKSRVIYCVCTSTYAAILVVRFNNQEVWPNSFAHAYVCNLFLLSSPLSTILHPPLLFTRND